jgi:hypothetical protein
MGEGHEVVGISQRSVRPSLVITTILQLTRLPVGFIALTPEMNKTLKYPTQPASETDDTPLVGLEVFHQLHCLNAIRKIVYGADPYFDPNNRQNQIHIGELPHEDNLAVLADTVLDHCIDYLRQVNTCVLVLILNCPTSQCQT